MTLILPRRRFLAGLVGLVAAPAVVKASSLMKIVAPPRPLLVYANRTIRDEEELRAMTLYCERVSQQFAKIFLYGDPDSPHAFTGLSPWALPQHSAERRAAAELRL